VPRSTRILPDLIEALGQAPDPDHALARWETLLGRLPSAVNLFRLFEQRPGLLALVLRVLTLAPPLADALALHPEWLDRLIDRSALDLPGAVDALAARMRSDSGDSYEARLDRIRRVVGEERFALGVQLVEARHDPLAVAGGLARVAEAALTAAAEAARDEFAKAHGTIPGGELVVLGLGRLGGGALTHASDLDLVYLFTGELGVESDGPRPLTASLYFNRLAQRVTAALSVPTAEGALYEIDTRLRPQGNQGPIAVSLDSFARYQREDAWAWEHMALCRARPVFGSPCRDSRTRGPGPRSARAAARPGQAARGCPRHARRDRGQQGAEGTARRQAVARRARRCRVHRPLPAAARARRVQAAASRRYRRAGRRRLLPAAMADHQPLLGRLLVSARLLAPDAAEPHEAAQAALAKACGQSDYGALLQALAEARHGVAATWADVFGEQLEIDR
jgi:glutamate-ammonia-ligase adenylyltransferase